MPTIAPGAGRCRASTSRQSLRLDAGHPYQEHRTVVGPRRPRAVSAESRMASRKVLRSAGARTRNGRRARLAKTARKLGVSAIRVERKQMPLLDVSPWNYSNPMELSEGCPLLWAQEVPSSNLGSPTKTQHSWCAVSRGQVKRRSRGITPSAPIAPAATRSPESKGDIAYTEGRTR